MLLFVVVGTMVAIFAFLLLKNMHMFIYNEMNRMLYVVLFFYSKFILFLVYEY